MAESPLVMVHLPLLLILRRKGAVGHSVPNVVQCTTSSVMG